jgi:hypothetical protein
MSTFQSALQDLSNQCSTSDVCYKPAALVSEEAKQQRAEKFAEKTGTAHDPGIIRATPRLPPPEHPTYKMLLERPLQEPLLSKRGRQLCGLEPY